ncbi:MAG: hypothetical protein HGB05_16130 [Chloroflexi bacterium]|nr:hypothetical protein [Chloroflexota bacterium]
MADITLDRSTVLADYLAAPDRLAEMVAGLDEVALARSLTADTWTIRQLVHHIVDGDDLWSVAVMAAIGNPAGVFTLQWYWDVPQTAWADKWRYADRDVVPSVELLKANRLHIAQLLEAVPEAWDRAITISVRGRDDERAPVAEIVEMQARHALAHIQEIEAILRT